MCGRPGLLSSDPRLLATPHVPPSPAYTANLPKIRRVILFTIRLLSSSRLFLGPLAANRNSRHLNCLVRAGIHSYGTRRFALGTFQALARRKSQRHWVIAFPVQRIEDSDLVATSNERIPRRFGYFIGRLVNPIEAVLCIPRLVILENHPASRAPNSIAIHVEAHENPTIGQ